MDGEITDMKRKENFYVDPFLTMLSQFHHDFMKKNKVSYIRNIEMLKNLHEPS